MSGSNTTMAIARPVSVESPRVKSERLVANLESTLKELNGCSSNADIQRISAKVEAIMAQMSNVSAPDAANRKDLVKSMREAELALRNDGQIVKAGRIAKMRKLMAKLPKESAKKQRKLLREILQLSGKNAGVTVGKRRFCGSNLCFGVCVTGSVLALAGASALVAVAATGHFENLADDQAVGDVTSTWVADAGAEEDGGLAVALEGSGQPRDIGKELEDYLVHEQSRRGLKRHLKTYIPNLVESLSEAENGEGVVVKNKNWALVSTDGVRGANKSLMDEAALEEELNDHLKKANDLAKVLDENPITQILNEQGKQTGSPTFISETKWFKQGDLLTFDEETREFSLKD